MQRRLSRPHSAVRRGCSAFIGKGAHAADAVGPDLHLLVWPEGELRLEPKLSGLFASSHDKTSRLTGDLSSTSPAVRLTL